VQAEQTTKQGKTVLVFTVVTIIFVCSPTQPLGIKSETDFDSSHCRSWQHSSLSTLITFPSTIMENFHWDTCSNIFVCKALAESFVFSNVLQLVFRSLYRYPSPLSRSIKKSLQIWQKGSLLSMPGQLETFCQL
jgi:hypothetical protein